MNPGNTRRRSCRFPSPCVGRVGFWQEVPLNPVSALASRGRIMLWPAGCQRYQGENRSDSLSTWPYIYQPVATHQATTADGHFAERTQERKCSNGNVLQIGCSPQVARFGDVQYVCCSITCCLATHFMHLVPSQQLKCFHFGLLSFQRQSGRSYFIWFPMFFSTRQTPKKKGKRRKFTSNKSNS